MKIAALALLVLTACGGGGDDSTSSAQAIVLPPPNTATKLLVIGNSLTYVPLRPNLGWFHEGGMAASDAAHDFVHLTASALGLAPNAQDFRPLELYPTAPVNIAQIPGYGAMADAATDVVVQLGDNVSEANLPVFPGALDALLQAVGARQALVCVSTWYDSPAKDAVIQAACTSHGGVMAYIGDVRGLRLDPAIPGENPAVASHPHNRSMALISARIVTALRVQHTY